MAFYWTLSLLSLVALALLVLYAQRAHLQDFLHLLPPRLSASLRMYAPVDTFERAAQSGLSSAAFDLAGNLEGDDRAGLDSDALIEIRRIMERRGVGFDEARYERHVAILRKNGQSPISRSPPVDARSRLLMLSHRYRRQRIPHRPKGGHELVVILPNELVRYDLTRGVQSDPPYAAVSMRREVFNAA